MAVLCPFLRQRYFDADGAPLAGGKLYFYEAGTLVAKDTYTDSTGLTPNSNPVILNANGEADVWLDGFYKVIIQDSSGAQQGDPIDNISAISSSSNNFSSPYFVLADVAAEASLPAATSYTLTGIDDSSREVLIQVKGLSLSGTQGLALRVGNGSIITSGYTGESRASTVSGGALEQLNWGDTLDATLAANTYAGLFTALSAATDKVDGQIVLTKSVSGFWDIKFLLTEYDTNEDGVKTYIGGGRVAVSGNLDRIQLLSGNTDTFDSGTILVKQYANTGTILGANPGPFSNEYTCTGTNSYTVTIRGGQTAPTAWFDGLEINTTVPNDNTLTAVTFTLDGVAGAKTAVMADGITVPPIGYLRNDKPAKLVYDSNLDKVVITRPIQIESIDITDSAVTTAKIADSAVTSAKILDGTIATADIADSAITTAKINDLAVTTAKLADGSVTSSKLAAGVGVLTTFNNSSELTSGTEHTVTGIPVCDRVEIFLRDVSLNNGDQIVLQLGHGATPTYIATGYTGKTTRGSGPLAWSTFAYLSNNLAAANTCGCHVVLQKQSSNVWTINMVGVEPTGAGEIRAGFGWVDVTATLTAIKVKSESTGTFDSGYITVTHF